VLAVAAGLAATAAWAGLAGRRHVVVAATAAIALLAVGALITAGSSLLN